MTAQPNISDFANTAAPASKQPVFMRANVTEHFWGFEVRPNEQIFDLAVLTRAVAGFFAGAGFIASLGFWLLPSMAFVATAFTSKLTVSVLLMVVASLLARFAARGTQVRVQFDTSAGELREVVDGAFGSTLILATYGLDAVEAVEVVESTENRGFGQVHICMRGTHTIASGDGAVSALATLRNRIANECGLETSGQAREAVWGGPLAA
ncbi:hypothetical protein [Octadecabacter ascidiaceicola]|uniref:Uncharacterized protein n=1 Tax=Octadecabacter ascidiaceicola TaxID=1655543 RepID=A0A238JPW6_9RHOB|nr:hypothetical protein [Octadecabacter ascidiaceicola]SMX32207.1 hypothetical protein OCA8868_00667 [Octadecabacter ascidiaceicola]